jgi:hypothetical protein
VFSSVFPDTFPMAMVTMAMATTVIMDIHAGDSACSAFS